MKEKVVIIGSYLCDLFKDGVVENDWDFLMIDFKLEYTKDILAIIKNKVSKQFDINKHITSKLEKKLNNLFEEIIKFKPTRILILRGYNFSPRTFNLLKELNVPLYLWTFDSISRFPEQVMELKMYKKVFAIDGGDIEDKPNINWMPIGFDSKYFYPKEEKVFDLLFIGRIDNKIYKKRYDFLMHINSSSYLKSYRVAFMGTTGSLIGDYRLRNKLRNIQFIGKKGFTDYSSLISSSRICINIHQDDGLKPINPMFFAIPAAGVCQITDDREYYSTWFNPQTEIIACSINNIDDYLIKLLRNDTTLKMISENGYNRAFKNYSIGLQLKKLFQS